MTHSFHKAERFIVPTLTVILCIVGRVGANVLVGSELNNNNCSRCSRRISVSPADLCKNDGIVGFMIKTPNLAHR